MADRSLRGMRLGSQSLQNDIGIELADRVRRSFRTDTGEIFTVVFSADAEVPLIWEDPKSGKEGALLDSEGNPEIGEVEEEKIARTHWDMLLERRTPEELEEVLAWRLQYLRDRRGNKEVVS
ncbi:MAG: RNA polymerase-binding protein RbpA [Microbacteriaceae bacterium]